MSFQDRLSTANIDHVL